MIQSNPGDTNLSVYTPGRHGGTLTDRLVPTGGLLRDLAFSGAGALFIALSAQVSIPLWFTPVPITGQTLAVLLVGATGGRLDPVTSLVLAGVAVASFFTAVQTFVQQRDSETIRQVYFFVLGQLRTAGWAEVGLVAPYTGVCLLVILALRRRMDALGVGDEEAGSLGLDVRRVRLVAVLAASLGTAAAVAVSGLIGFVGIIVPHTIRLLFGASYRVILPLTVLFGGAFLVAADLVARLALEPAEIPIGVVTAFLGAPFFVLVLRTARRSR